MAAALCGTVAAALVGVVGALPASASTATSTQAGPITKIAIPMYVDPPSGSSAAGTRGSMTPDGVVAPETRIPSNCGTAFLCVSGTYDSIHVDYGFEYLTTPAFAYTAHAGGINLDYPGTFYDSVSGSLAGRRSWERQFNRSVGTGEWQVTAYIKAWGPTYSCSSSPALVQDHYIY